MPLNLQTLRKYALWAKAPIKVTEEELRTITTYDEQIQHRKKSGSSTILPAQVRGEAPRQHTAEKTSAPGPETPPLPPATIVELGIGMLRPHPAI